MRITIKDVAQKANLSISTVSRAINRSGYVSEEARDRIYEVISELDYRPNWMARSLKGKQSRIIGLIIPDIFNVYYTSIAYSVSTILRQYGYEVILCLNNEDRNTDLNFLKVLEEKRVDGIIYVYPANGSNSSYVRELANAGMPIVELNRQRESDILDAVLADNFHGAYQMTNHLINKGHRRIGFIIGEAELTTGNFRISGYRRALKDSKIPIDPDLIRIGTFTRDHGEKGARELLELSEPPTAIFAGSNRILMGVLYVIGQKGIHIPDDISIVSFNDAEWLGVWNPPITAVDVAAQEMAQLAIEILLRRVASPERKSKPVTYHLSTLLIVRNSCKDLGQQQLTKKEKQKLVREKR